MRKKIINWITCSLKKGAWAPILVFASHIIAIYIFNIYSIFLSFDIPMHFLGGISISYFYVYVVCCGTKEGILGKLSLFVSISMVFLLTATTTIFWEFAEWTLDTYFGAYTQVGLNDTLLDMFLGIVGGITTIIFQFNKLK